MNTNIKLIVVLILAVNITAYCNEIEFSSSAGYDYYLMAESDGDKPVYGNEITITITKTAKNGELLAGFEKERSTYILGLNEALDKWNQLLLQMKTGEERLIRVPSEAEDGYDYYRIKLIEIVRGAERKPYDIQGKTRIITPSGLEYIIIHQGSGFKAAPGYTVTFHYTGMTEDMEIFGSSYADDKPVTLTLGIDPMIMGWFEGLCLMKEGDQMRLIIPAELGYREGGVPANVDEDAVLIFDIDLLKVR